MKAWTHRNKNTNPNTKSGSPNVVDLFTGGLYTEINQKRYVRIAPEIDGFEMLYSNDNSESKLYALKVVCWALRANGELEGLVPWLDQLVPCSEINDPLNGQWEGYRDPRNDQIFFEAPEYKKLELESAAQYCEAATDLRDTDGIEAKNYLQEIPDMVGTHAVLTDNGFKSFTLIEVFAWRLDLEGRVSAMLIDETKIISTPILLGDPCLFQAQDHPEFRYFFQNRIANKIKAEDPEALAAISLLIEE